MSVVPGIEVLVREEPHCVRSRRVALLAHAASVDRNLVPAWDLLGEAGADLVAVLSPEHGLFGEAQDMEAVDGGLVVAGGREVPLVSLYGCDEASLAPRAEDLGGAEVLVVDLADVGARYYTYAATADMAASVCLERGIEVIVADRPNPLGGAVSEGGAGFPEGLRSLVGHFDVPHRHGLTLGELVRSRAGKGVHVVRAGGWSRGMDEASCDLPWVPPSPNMPSPRSAWVYPGGCLVEGTNLSEGRGTTRPFETVGAPFLDGTRLASVLGSIPLGGVRFRPLRFRPMFHKHAAKVCSGVFVHVTDRSTFRPLRTYMAILWAARTLAGEQVRWRTDTYEFRSDVPAIDLLWGGSELREAIDSGASIEDILSLPERGESDWDEVRASHHIY